MNLKTLFEPLGDFRMNEDLKKHTSFAIGPKVKGLLIPEGINEALKAISICKEKGIPYFVMGNGSNLLIEDEDFEGLVIKFGNPAASYLFKGDQLIASAGTSLIVVAFQAMNYGLGGLEFASGIPGSIGGGLYMNAGAYKKALSDVLIDVLVLTPQGLALFKKDQLDYGYRHSLFQKHRDWVILAARFQLYPDNIEAMLARAEDRRQRRMNAQPVEQHSAGSVFRNPPDRAAWQIVEELGFRGRMNGGAQVSEKHANFIVNPEGKASFHDVSDLIEQIRSRSRDEYGIELIPEIERINLNEQAR